MPYGVSFGCLIICKNSKIYDLLILSCAELTKQSWFYYSVGCLDSFVYALNYVSIVEVKKNMLDFFLI